MDFRIRKVILWPQNSAFPRREVPFSVDRVNVLTGDTRTGKSALIHIIDYCLGNGKCTIPVGPIRKLTAWFGLEIEVGSRTLLLARPEPGRALQAGRMYLGEGEDLVSDAPPVENIGVEDFREYLGRLAGLTDLDFDGGVGEATFRSRPSFRDMAAFNFQPQHIVANPYTLFFKADTREHQQKLRTVFPLVLGIEDAEMLRLRRELEDVNRELNQKRKELEGRRKVAGAWLAELRGAYVLAREYGLLNRAAPIDDQWSHEDYVRRLRNVPGRAKTAVLPMLDVGVTNDAVDRVRYLQRREFDVAYELGALRGRLDRLSELAASSSNYQGALRDQNARLASVGWFSKQLAARSDEGRSCPFCGAHGDAAVEHIRELEDSALRLSQLSTSMDRSTAVLHGEVASVRAAVRAKEEELNATRKERAILEQQDQRALASRQRLEEVTRFAGRLEQSLENLSEIATDSDLVKLVEELDQRRRQLRRQLDPEAVERRRSGVTSELSRYITGHAKNAGVEDGLEPAWLDTDDLTIRVQTAGERVDYLWEIGGASNHMGFHLGALLGLHEFFLRRPSSPVPSFLVIDQPSQVYYPDAWPEQLIVPDENDLPESEKELTEIRRTTQIFEALARGFQRTEYRLQMIVLDHVGSMVWKRTRRADLFHHVDDWRAGKALIPHEWVDAEADPVGV